MASATIDEIYDKLLEIFQVRYPYNPREVLSYKISELVGEGRTRENAILILFEREGKTTLTEARELGETVRKEKEETIEKQIKEHKKSVETLTLLFSKGELTEESYEAAIKPLEHKIARLEKEKKEDEIKVLEERLAELKSVTGDEAAPKPKRESIELPVPSSPPEVLPEEPYERSFSLAQRFYKLLTSPSEAMRDIAFAPDYYGVLVVIAFQVVYLSAAVAMVFQKIRFSGPYATTLSGMLSGLLVAAIFVSAVILLVKWLGKSLIVKYFCDSGSEWDFKTAASITGYAYIADIVMGLIGMCVGWFLLPTLHFETADIEAMRQTLNDYEAQLSWLRLLYSLPFSLFGLLWKSYLGGLGTRFGTKEKCSLSMGIAVFFGLSLIGLMISFIT
jgi:hypothetical protein